MTATKTLPPHGTLSRHKYHGCKCATCYEGYRTYQRSRHRKQGYGTWQPYVDAEPIRQHLLKLREQGIGFTRVAELAGLYPATVGGFLYDLGNNRPRKVKARPEIAARILAVTADTTQPWRMDATGTRRRLQALAANGWPFKSLGPHIGVHPATVARLLHQDHVYASTATAVADTYQSLAEDQPEQHGVTPGMARRARNHAEREGWRTPQWWEDMGDIDDPDFDPDKADAAPTFLERAALRREEIIHLAWSGNDPDHIHARLNEEVSISTVRAIVREWQTGQKRDRRVAAA
ncbi:hypothetical protein [Streptomyces yunnanensis]|uniref:Helix-turn-helix domain-containing protein n=1 Tax=Streptomyces yunnanensis TaxID=156453 RepID=A0A9X8MT29_9ACTN|nr:hypothetical protein [Streptomyces yunnanensis]SHL73576.1 hypothetical protein SAMN05216268_10619 [Streptomyces yunnanensis]